MIPFSIPKIISFAINPDVYYKNSYACLPAKICNMGYNVSNINKINLIYSMIEVLNQLKKIASLQCNNSIHFRNGLFNAERIWAKRRYVRNDNTAFFSACIAFTLIRYKKYFTSTELQVANNIISQMQPAFDAFRNKDGHASYNFWETKPTKHFPGGYFAKRFKFFMIPDDIDDSAIIHIVKPHTRLEQLSLKEKMSAYAIGNLKWPDRPVEGYETLKPYNTFFVKNMPSAFDICALCNALYFSLHYNLPLNEQDEHSLKLIHQCLENDDHLKRPCSLSPYYPNTVLIIYHMVRLACDFKILQQYVQKLITQCYAFLNNATLAEMERLMLVICIEKLEESCIEISEPNDTNKARHPFFVAGLLGEVSPKWLRKISNYSFTQIKYTCSGYAEVLWLEHLLLFRKHQKTI